MRVFGTQMIEHLEFLDEKMSKTDLPNHSLQALARFFNVSVVFFVSFFYQSTQPNSCNMSNTGLKSNAFSLMLTER